MRIATTLEILRSVEDGQDPTTIPGSRRIPRAKVERVLAAAGWPDIQCVTETRRRLQYEYEQQQREPRTVKPLNEEAIQVAMTGERTYLRPVERREAVRRLVALEVNDEEICRRLRICGRTVRRIKQQSTKEAA